MLDEPDVDHAKLAETIKQGWDIDVAEIRFLPLGLDYQAWAYEVGTTTGDRYFLKVRNGEPGLASVLVPRWLYENGAEGVVGPIPPTSGGPWRELDDFRLVLYPFIDGQNRWSIELTDKQWTAYGSLLATVHTAQPPMAELIPVEDFASTAAARARSIAAAHRAPSDHDSRRQLAELWSRHGDAIADLADRTETLGQQAAAAGVPPVLCHADAHAGNLLADGDGRVWLVDWDTLIWAPAERDLMFVLGAATFADWHVTSDDTEAFRRGYGSSEMNPTVLAYYAHERLLDDIASFAAHIVAGGASDEALAESVYWLRGNLEAMGPFAETR